VADEVLEAPNKNRGLLHVPSRSSSHNIQPSPTSTGLSGATGSDPRGSIGGRSKESKTSILRRRRNGSATSSKMSIKPPGHSPGPAEKANPTASHATATRQPKKQGLLSFLSCCGVPDYANTIDPSETIRATKVTKIAAGRPTTAGRPDNSTAQQSNVLSQPQTEKGALQQAEPEHQKNDIGGLESSSPPGLNGELNRSLGDAREQPLPELPNEAESSSVQADRAILVQGHTRTESKRVATAQDSAQNQKDGEGDIQMDDSGPLPSEKGEPVVPVPRKDDTANKTVLPPPPPGPPLPGPSDELAAPETAGQKQQWLLPPIAPRFQGKKCLVLDLDETLVHSSFKVNAFVLLLISAANKKPRFYTRPILLFLLS
jgi:RNA polymerase II subunit A small phosphatase-like protein